MKPSLLLLALLLCGCSREPTARAADNTGRNSRDKSGETLTPTDQSESASDRTLTQDIRKALMDDSSLSMNAKNIKIVTIGGKVTLRGVVASEAEKTSIVAKVQAQRGVQACDDQLEVKTN